MPCKSEKLIGHRGTNTVAIKRQLLDLIHCYDSFFCNLDVGKLTCVIKC
jgi:hypothetical protein